MSDDSLRLESFDSPLRGKRVLVVGDAETWISRMSILESESLYKGRSILVIQESKDNFVNPLLFKRRWDIVFRVREQFELQMVATYAANAPKPIRVLWVNGDSEIPRALWTKWIKQDITLIGGSVTGNIGGCEWEAIFFPHKCPQAQIENTLGKRGSGIANMAVKIREHMSEIVASEAAIAWSNINESDVKGCLYWYDPAEGKREDPLFTKNEASILLESLSRWIQGVHI